MNFECSDYIKLVVLKVDPFFTEIIDEGNFKTEDEYGAVKFKRQYIEKDDCVIVKINM